MFNPKTRFWVAKVQNNNERAKEPHTKQVREHIFFAFPNFLMFFKAAIAYASPLNPPIGGMKVLPFGFPPEPAMSRRTIGP